jgi:AcrR family transcriptional regulator
MGSVGRLLVCAPVRDLDSERIATAALAVIDERGAKGFTMRAVAEALDVTPMALYYHVADKQALVTLVVDLVVRETPLPDETGVWRDDLWEMARWMRQIAAAHPGVSELSRHHQVWTPAVLPMTDRWFRVWQTSGLTPGRAVQAAAASSLAIVGVEAADGRFDELEVPASSQLAKLPHAVTAFLRKRDRDAEFELIVRSLIDGLYARLSNPS